MSTNIEWTDETWNPTRGCSRVSPGCKNCYAERQAIRQRNTGYKGLVTITNGHPAWTGEVRIIPERLDDPFHWRKPRRIFVDSMSDLFHENVPDEFIDRVFAVMARCPQHTFQVLTKRPERMWHIMTEVIRTQKLWPMNNVWLGVSIENQEYADQRIPWLLRTPAAVRFISAEPLLGPLRLWKLSSLDYFQNTIGYETYPLAGMQAIPDCDWKHNKLDWVIVGGESGPGARPFYVEWARNIVGQCKEAGVPVFVKQLGANVDCEWSEFSNYDMEAHGYPIRDRKGGDPAEWPEDLQIRQFPEAKTAS